MEQPGKIAIVGYGGMGCWHAKLLKSVKEAHLVGIYDIDPARNKAAQRAGIHAYESYEELLADSRHMPLLRQLDILVDGPFILEEKSLIIRFRGSRNQRIIDVPRSLAEGRVVLHPAMD